MISTFCLPLGALAQQSPSAPNAAPSPPATNTDQRVTNPPPPTEQKKGAGSTDQKSPIAYITFKTPYEFWLTGLSIAVLIVMGAMLCFMAYTSTLSQEFFKAFLILVVVFAALFLIVAGYTDQQTAPVFSLLGTIAGYIFGRSTSGGDNARRVEDRPEANNDGADPPFRNQANITGTVERPGAVPDLPR
jgi:hypothetical protein